MGADLVVVGSINHDLTIVTERHPSPGETVLGRSHYMGAGGKGANQAVAAARLGSSVAMIGRVGNDEEGASLISLLSTEGIDVTGVGIDPGTPTGLAVITLDDNGENSIVVSPGANSTLGVADIAACEKLIGEAKVVLAQLEIPMDVVLAAASAARGLFCLNPAPARPLPKALLERADVLVPNRSELATLAGVAHPASLEEVIEAADRLEYLGATVVTLGAGGCVVIDDNTVTPIEAPIVDAVDTTGAGDAFCGALAHRMSRGEPLPAAAVWATRAAALATTRRGAQAAMPTAAQVERSLGR
jgi:ribokinase